MTIEEKYKIVYKENKRYYEFDMTTRLPVLEDTIPYFFKYRDIEIQEGTWNKMTFRILDEIDKINPKDETELLTLKYNWSAQNVFSKENRINFTRFKNIYLNTNHTSTHAMMNIQFLLKFYGINLSECYFLIRKHFNAEPKEVVDHIRKETIAEFKTYLLLIENNNKRADTIINNFFLINSYLKDISEAYYDFFLFDEYSLFTNYLNKTLEKVKKVYGEQGKNYLAIKKCLFYLNNFYKNREFYLYLSNNHISNEFLSTIRSNIDYLYKKNNTTIIAVKALYDRMLIVHSSILNEMGKFQNIDNLFVLCTTLLSKDYFYKNEFISKDPIKTTKKEEIIKEHLVNEKSFTINDVDIFSSTIGLKNISYFDLFECCSDKFVQVECDKMISKDFLNMNSNTLDDIKKELSFYINSFNEIDSKKYQSYASLPLIKNFNWNKYSLFGFIRSYYKNYFDVVVTNKNIKNLEYTIKSK